MKLDLSINVSKSRCIRVGRRFKSEVETIKINDVVVNWVDKLRYLGAYIKAGRTFKLDLHENRTNFFRAANCLIAKVGTKNVAVVMSLIVSKCLPLLMYGLTALHLLKSEKSKLDNCLDLVMAKIFGSYNKVILRQCLFYTGYLPVGLCIDLSAMKFLKNVINLFDTNSQLFYFLNCVRNDDLTILLNSHRFAANDSAEFRRQKMWNVFELLLPP